jgi:Ti-type conjugative transfer relaxase TraA
MACYHIQVKIISRGGGKCAVSAAAYRSRDKLYDERLGMTFDYTKKKDLAYAEILLPENARERLKDRQTLWNEVERVEKRKDARLSREVELALPKELNLEQQVALVKEYTQSQFVDKGMIADICIHKSDKNPHVHIMLTTREVTQDGFGKKVTAWNDKAELLKWREEWANIQNRHLLQAGYDIQVDHRSFADRGIDLEPTSKIGIAAKYLPKGYLHLQETRGLDRLEEYQRICRENGERIINDPAKALKHVGHYDAVFKQEDIMDFAFRHSADADQFNSVFSALENSPELIKIGRNEKGEDLFSTRTMMMSEKAMLDNARAMKSSNLHVLGKDIINQTAKNYTMSEEQEKAFRNIAESGDISVMIGRAGTGKSYTLGAVKEAYEASGYRVRGLALSGIAAEGLQNESGIESTTIFRQLDDWENERNLISKDQILVVDEAGMVGTRQMHKILENAHKAGAKVILVGDNEQLQSIEAGGSFRGIIERTGYVELAEVRRQHVEWQKQATVEFSGNKEQAEKALEMYHDHGLIIELQSRQDAKDRMLKDWANQQQLSKQKHETSLMMAYTNRDVNELNQGAREQRKMHGELQGYEHTFMTEKGERNFCVGDRIIFLRNEHSLGVRNGSLGTVESINREGMSVKLDKGDRVAIDTSIYKDFDHGYAATVHKTQGSTLDHTFVLGSRHFDKHTAYVAMSRHRENVTMYYGKDDFRNFEDLQRVMSREQAKGLVVDYGLPRGIEVDNRVIEAERVLTNEERRIQAQEWQQQKDQEQYIKQMKERGVQVEFAKDKSVAGYFERREEIGGRSYAVIDTRANPTKGTRYLIPYEKQFDQMQMHHYVAYDGKNMEYAKKSRTPEKEIQHQISQEKQDGKGISTLDRKLTLEEINYCQRMQERGLKVDFPGERAVEGYYTKIEELGSNKYAVIESKGIRHMVPYDKQYDQMQMHRYVSYDGQKMRSVKVPSIKIEKNQGLELGKKL